MGAHEQITRILQARYELDCASREQKPDRLTELNRLLDEAIAGTPVSRIELLHSLHPRYQDFKRERRREETVRGQQKFLGPDRPA